MAAASLTSAPKLCSLWSKIVLLVSGLACDLMLCIALVGCSGASRLQEENDEGRASSVGGNAGFAKQQSPNAAESWHPDIIVPAGTHSLCVPREVFIFSCSLGRKIVSICGGRTPSGRSYVQYRQGERGHIDFAYPDRLNASQNTFTRSFEGYTGGGESQIRFTHDETQYLVYSLMRRSGLTPDGNSRQTFEAGLVVSQDNTVISENRCVETVDDQPLVNNGADAQIDLNTAAIFISEGPFVNHD